MKYKIELLIVASVLFCLLLAQAAPAANTMKVLYVDGAKIAESNDNTSGLTFPYAEMVIGAENDRYYLYNEYIGKMAEFAIYKGVLSDPCILAHYNAKDSNNAYTAAVQDNHPLLWLRFRDASTNDNDLAKNSGSIGIDGNYVQTGGGPITQVAGINADSNAINIPDAVDGAPGHCVNVWDGNGDFGSDLEGDVTIELWVNFVDFGSMSSNDWPRLFSHKGGYGAMVNGPNSLGIMGGDATNYLYCPNDINDGKWHHIVITYNSTYDQPNLPPSGTYVEEVNKDNPVLWLRFEDAQAKDYSVADGNHWVGYGAAASIVERAGGIGKSVYLNGSGGSGVYGVAATNNPNSPPLINSSYEIFDNNYAFAPNDITFEIWYKTLPAGQPQPEDFGYFFQQVGSSGNEPCAPAVGNSSGTIRVWGGSAAWYSGVSPKFDANWHQLVVTYDENNVDPCNMIVQLYLDGILKGTNSFTGAKAKLGPEMSHILIGGRNDIGNTYNLFAGYVDEFAIYAGILDPNRVMAHYSAWQPKNCADTMSRNPAVAADLNEDCKVNFEDFAEFALNWARCNDPTVGAPSCPPNW
jgi:hypothetical protein